MDVCRCECVFRVEEFNVIYTGVIIDRDYPRQELYSNPPRHHFFPLCVRSATAGLTLSTTDTIILIQQSDFLIHSHAKKLSLCFGTQDRLDLPAFSSHSAETRPIDHHPGSMQTETGTWPPSEPESLQNPAPAHGMKCL